MAICCAFSVAASIILVWRRYYVLAPIAIGLAVILLYGLLNAGLNGVEMRAYNMVLENKGNIFLSPSHAEYTMWGSRGCVKTTHPLFLQTKPRLSQARALSCPKDFVPLDIENLIIWQRYIIVLTIPTESSFFHKE